MDPGRSSYCRKDGYQFAGSAPRARSFATPGSAGADRGGAPRGDPRRAARGGHPAAVHPGAGRRPRRHAQGRRRGVRPARRRGLPALPPGRGHGRQRRGAQPPGGPARGAPPRRPSRSTSGPASPTSTLFPRTAWGRASRAALRAMPPELSDDDRRGPAAAARRARRVPRPACAGSAPTPTGSSSAPGSATASPCCVDGAGTTASSPSRTPATRRPRARWPRRDPRRGGAGRRATGSSSSGCAATAARAVVVTPAHQSPTGVVLSPDAPPRARRVGPRRRRLRHRGRLRRRVPLRPPPGRRAAGPRPRSRRLLRHHLEDAAPGLRLGWLVLPADLVDPVVRPAAGSTDGATSASCRRRSRSSCANGDLDRHLRRSRRVYRRAPRRAGRRAARWLPEATVSGIAAGLSAVLVTLPAGLDEPGCIERATAQRGCGSTPLATSMRGRPGAHGQLLLGYGCGAARAGRAGIRLLADAVRAITGPPAGPRRARVHLVDGASACAGSVVPP